MAAAAIAVVNAPHSATLQALAATDFFNDEANVNSVWNGLFNEAFHVVHPGTLGNSYLLAPEGKAADGKRALRADILILKLAYAGTPPVFSGIIPVLSFEGKSGVSTDKYEQIGSQLHDWYTNSGYDKKGYRVFAVGARGSDCWFFYHDATSSDIRNLNLTGGGGAPRKLATGNKHETYNVAVHYTTILQTLQWFAANPGARL
ncbi:hypothetical protein DL95DRAFT_416290 [Leptodontidium sp. 2 PMI_412]|nr:hypothetical protein DL95DRAFT_416290 [Leptodontidium sp. 2 PMI_412]